MAPIRARARARARTAASTVKPTAAPTATNPSISSATASQRPKDTKRAEKHDRLLSRVRSGGVGKSSIAGATVAAKKRRRPAKKLRATESFDALRNALPDAEDDDEWEGIEEDGQEGGAGKKRVRMHSLKHRPGAMKRKETLVKSERERFAKNLAQMAAGDGAKDDAAEGAGGQAQKDKWEALRRHIGAGGATQPGAVHGAG